MHVPCFMWVGLLLVSGTKTIMHMPSLTSVVFTPLAMWRMCCLFLSTDVEYPFWNIKQTLFEAYTGCDTFGKALFTEFLWAHNQHLRTVIEKECDPIVSPTLFSSTLVFFSLSSLHLFISPLCHLSSYFLSSFSPFVPPLPFITVLCDTYLVAASHPLFHWEKGEATKHSMVGAAFLCVLIRSHLIIHNGSDHHSQFPQSLGWHYRDSRAVALCMLIKILKDNNAFHFLMSYFPSCSCIVLEEKIDFPLE